jgi:hypothetical protein
MHAHRVAVADVGETADVFTPADLVKHVVRFTVAAVERLRDEGR